MTEMREILLERSRACVPRATVIVETACGSVSVTIIGERTNSRLYPLITLHDFGFDHVSQFKTLENSGHEAERFFDQFITYHIDLPGCEDGAGDYGGEYKSLDELSDIVFNVRNSLNITLPMVVLGVGAGASIAMRYMLNHTRTLLGLILIEPTNDSETWLKWTQNKLTDMVMKPSDIVSIRSKKEEELAANLLDKHFGRASSPTPLLTDSRHYLNQRLLTLLNVRNHTLYYNSYYQRKKIPESAFTNSSVVPSLVISGRQSWRNDASVDVRADLQLSKQEISLQEPSICYLMPLEEAPKKSAIAMMLFIQSVGIGLTAGLTDPSSIQDVYQKQEPVDNAELVAV